MKIFKLIVSTITSSLILLGNFLTFSVKSAPDTNGHVTVLVGDFDNNGIADLTDLSCLCIYLMNRSVQLDRRTFAAADVDQNQQTDIADLARMKQYISKDKKVRTLGTVQIPKSSVDVTDPDTTEAVSTETETNVAVTTEATTAVSTKKASPFPDNLPDISEDADKMKMLETINKIREEKGLTPLKMTAELSYVAEQRAKELKDCPNYQQRPDGSRYTTLLHEYGKSSSHISQLYYKDSSTSCMSDFISVVTSNYNNYITSADFRECGVGSYTVGSKTYWVIFLIR